MSEFHYTWYVLERKRPRERTFWPLSEGVRNTRRECEELRKIRQAKYPENSYRVGRYWAEKQDVEREK